MLDKRNILALSCIYNMIQKLWYRGIAAMGIACVFIWVLSHFLFSSSARPGSVDRLGVVASFYPLADFARAIGGEYVQVTTLVPAGAEPHEYEPTPKDIAAMYEAKVVLFHGEGVDGWVERLRSDLEAHHVRVVRLADTAPVYQNKDSVEKIHKDEADEHGANDPHTWLDPVQAMVEVDAIAQAFIQTDPDHAAAYVLQRDAFKVRLVELDQAFVSGLANCKTRTIFTSHNAFGWMARRYHLVNRFILGLSPDEEPSSKGLAELVTLARAEQIRYIFFETLVDPRLSQTLAREIGAQTLTLNPIEGLTDAEIQAGKNYVSVMRDNLAHLRIALSCI